jgi:hypothetical protein
MLILPSKAWVGEVMCIGVTRWEFSYVITRLDMYALLSWAENMSL